MTEFQKIIDQLIEQIQLFSDFTNLPNVQIEKRFQREESEIYVLVLKQEQDSLRLYVKIGKEENFHDGTLLNRLNAEYNCLQSTYEHFKNEPMFFAIRPIAYLPELRAIVTLESPGKPLKPMVMSHSKILSMHKIDGIQKAMFLCGKWLRDFHQYVNAETEFEMEGFTSYISRRLEILEKAGLVSIHLGKILKRRLEESEQAYRHSFHTVLLHNDFIPGNVLFNGEKISVLDFSWVGKGCNYFDIVSFWLELQRLAEMPNYSKKKISLLQKTFLDAYGGIDVGSIEFKFFELLHRVNSAAVLWRSSQRNRWPHKIILDFEMKKQLRWLQEFIK